MLYSSHFEESLSLPGMVHADTFGGGGGVFGGKLLTWWWCCMCACSHMLTIKKNWWHFRQKQPLYMEAIAMGKGIWKQCPFFGCPFLGGCFIRSRTVPTPCAPEVCRKWECQEWVCISDQTKKKKYLQLLISEVPHFSGVDTKFKAMLGIVF